MKLIAITQPSMIEDESVFISKLFKKGFDIVHLRKPDANIEQCRSLLRELSDEERRKIVRHYGAEVILVHDDGNIGDCIDRCLKMAVDMQKNNKNVFVPQQFENPANPKVTN